MPMKKSQRLAPLLKLEKNREYQNLQTLGNARSAAITQADKLQQLISYKTEYEQMINRQGDDGITASHLQKFHQFLNRLALAITQQKTQLDLASEQEKLARSAWFEQRSAVKRMDLLIERKKSHERYDENKREQKMLDEQSQQLRYRVRFN